MKKKLVSILLSLSMCAAYAMPLTTAAANEPAEAPEVIETAAPNASWSPKTTSPNVIQIGTLPKTSVDVPFGDTVDFSTGFDVPASYKGTSGESITVTSQAFTIGYANEKNDKKYITIDAANKKITGIKKTSKPIPVKITVTRNNETSEAQLDVNVVEKSLSSTSQAVTVTYLAGTGGDTKTYTSLEESKNKIKAGNKGLTVKVGDTTLKKSDYTVDAITPEGEAVTKQVGNKTFTYYVASPSAVSSSSVVSAPAISKTVTIKIKGKGNYKDEFTVTGQTVNIQPQRINPGTISGGVVTFGSIGNAMDGLTLDDGTEATKDNVKFKAKTKNIKVDKDGNVTVKGLSTTDATKASIEVTAKKNKNATATVNFELIPLEISADETVTGATLVTLNWDKVLGTESSKKTYKNLAAFESKFIGKDPSKPKASGLVATVPNAKNASKPIKLKAAGKDYSVSVTWGGVKAGVAHDNLTPEAYVETVSGSSGSSLSVVRDVTFTIEGKGNYTGTSQITKTITLEPQIVETMTGIPITFNDLSEDDIFAWINVDKGLNNVRDTTTGKEDIIKALKLKSNDKNLKVKVKDGKGTITLNGVPDSGKASVTVTVKKNNKSADAVKDVEFIISKCPATHSSIKVDDTTFTNKTLKKDKAKDSIEKSAVVKFGDKKLKKNKDVDKIEVTDSNISTGSSVKVNVRATLKGNYVGTVTGSVTVKEIK